MLDLLCIAANIVCKRASEDRTEAALDLAGLGVLAAPSAVEAAHGGEHLVPHKGIGGWLVHGKGKPAAELGGLAMLAAIPARHLLSSKPPKPPPMPQPGAS